MTGPPCELAEDVSPYKTPRLEVGGALAHMLQLPWSPYYELARHHLYDCVLFVRVDDKHLNFQGCRLFRMTWFNLVTMKHVFSHSTYFQPGEEAQLRERAGVIFEHRVFWPSGVNFFTRVK